MTYLKKSTGISIYAHHPNLGLVFIDKSEMSEGVHLKVVTTLILRLLNKSVFSSEYHDKIRGAFFIASYWATLLFAENLYTLQSLWKT